MYISTVAILKMLSLEILPDKNKLLLHLPAILFKTPNQFLEIFIISSTCLLATCTYVPNKLAISYIPKLWSHTVTNYIAIYLIFQCSQVVFKNGIIVICTIIYSSRVLAYSCMFKIYSYYISDSNGHTELVTTKQYWE